MAAARQAADWERTAELMAMLYNCHVDTKKYGAKRGTDFFKPPWVRRQARPPIIGTIGAQGLKDLFIHRRDPTDVKGV